MSNPLHVCEFGSLGRTQLRRVLLILSLTEITSWGVLYYAFPVLLPTIAEDTGWDPTAVTAAFSTSQVVAAGLGIGVGRIIDRFGPRAVMTGGSTLAIPAILTIANATHLAVFFAGWLMAGIAMAGVLYPPAFAALTHWGGKARVRALTVLTLVGGLASTVFAPLTALISRQLDWRDTYLVLLMILALITIPAHWLGLRQPWTPNTGARRKDKDPRIRQVACSRPFLLLAVCMSATAFSVYAVVINLVPLLIERGFTPEEAALALGLGGIGQVTGRVAYATVAARTTPTSRTVAVCAFVAGATGLLAVLPGPMLALTAVCMLFGVARGALTLVQATAIADRWGVRDFGRLNGLLTAPVLFASAIAPFVGAALAAVTGAQAGAFLVLTAVAMAAAVIASGTAPSPSPKPRTHGESGTTNS